jgi:hypothetical protein
MMKLFSSTNCKAKLAMLKKAGRFLVVILISVFAVSGIFVNASPPKAYSLSENDLKAVMQETTFYDDSCSTTTATSSIIGNKSIYALGDSVLVEMESSGNLMQKLTNVGYDSVIINSIDGRSITGAGEQTEADPPQSALDAAKADTASIAAAGTIVITLGTYADDYYTSIPLLMDTIRGANGTARVFWVNAATNLTDYVTRARIVSTNTAIGTNKTKYNYSIIDWSTTTTADKTLLKPASWLPSDPAGLNRLNTLLLEAVGQAPSGAPASSAQVPSGSVTEQNAAIAWNFLAGKQLTAIQIAGVMGNLDRESAGTFRPDIVQNGPYSSVMKINGKAGYGIAQWTSIGRQQGLHNAMVAAGYPNRDDVLDVQLQYLWTELTGDRKTAYKYLQSSTDIKTATWAIMKYYEGPRCQTEECLANRVELSKKWFDKFSNGAPSVASTSACTNTGLGMSSDGFVFPQKTTKSQLESVPGNGSWLKCTFETLTQEGSVGKPSSIPNPCHHDYLAADIMNSTGTPVIAPRPGVISFVLTSADNGVMIGLYSDKALGGDGLWYYFAHSLPGSEKVKVNDKVKGGDELAQVGTSDNAGGSAPHTHFDVSPVENSFSRIAAGTEGPLVSPYKALQSAYTALPEL